MQRQNNSAQSYPCWPSPGLASASLHSVSYLQALRCRASSVGLEGARSMPPSCEHPFSPSTGGREEVKKGNGDFSSQSHEKLNSTRLKSCQFLSEDCLQKH